MTLPEAYAVGLAAGVATYVGSKVFGLAEDVGVDLFVRAVESLSKNAIDRDVAKQTAICDTQFPIGGPK